MLEDEKKLDNCFDNFQPDVVIHLAAQAMRYSLENLEVILTQILLVLLML